MESNLSETLQMFKKLEELLSMRILYPDEAYYEKMFEISPRICSKYSLKSVSMPSALIVLDLIMVKPGQRVCDEDWRHIRKLQLADFNYDKQSTINIIITTDKYSFLMTNGLQRLEEPIVLCPAGY